MSAMSQFRRVAAFVCLAALLFAAVMPGAAGLSLTVLATLWFIIEIVAIVPLPRIDGLSFTQWALALPGFSPRPPPVR